MKDGWEGYFTRRMGIILLLGFVSGVPLALTASTLAAWLSEAHVDKGVIGLFAAAAIPYTLKFLWAPLMDSLPVPVLTGLLGRRRGWMLATQLLVILALVLLGLSQPDQHPWLTAWLALLTAFASASQDIVIDAYRVEILQPEQQGEGAAMIQLGYRLGMLASSAGSLYLAASLGWQSTYLIMAGTIGLGVATTLLSPEPDASLRVGVGGHQDFRAWFRASVLAPFLDFMTRPSWALILIFILIYKLADAFIGIMTNPFYLEVGFSKTEIASVVKIFGTLATIAGTLIGGTLTARYGAVRLLFVTGFLHALTNLLYVLQAQVGVNIPVLAASVTMENFTGGMSAAAFVAFLSTLTSVHYTATQYALLSSLAAFGRTWFSTPAGYAAKYLGWSAFFTSAAFLAIPGLVVLYVLSRRLKATSPRAAAT